jgi:hypothetical protein
MISDRLFFESIKRHRSRLGYLAAPSYTHYLNNCRKRAPVKDAPKPEIIAAAKDFRHDGIAGFSTIESETLAQSLHERLAAKLSKESRQTWISTEGFPGYLNYSGDLYGDFPEIEMLLRGDLGDFLNAVFETHFKILYGTLYRNIGVTTPRVGSQRWHSDSGPGTCINVMLYLEPTRDYSGALEALPWRDSLEIFRNERSVLRHRHDRGFAISDGANTREMICNFYDEIITDKFASRIRCPTGPAGLIVPFLNNTLHRGGYPALGEYRTAIVFHCYPSDRPIDFSALAQRGLSKTVPYPSDPAAAF